MGLYKVKLMTLGLYVYIAVFLFPKIILGSSNIDTRAIYVNQVVSCDVLSSTNCEIFVLYIFDRFVCQANAQYTTKTH